MQANYIYHILKRDTWNRRKHIVFYKQLKEILEIRVVQKQVLLPYYLPMHQFP